MSVSPGRTAPARRVRMPLRRPALHTLVITHIAVSVGLLGDSAGFLAVAIRRAASGDEAFRRAARELLAMFALFFGIPLSFLALLTGVALAFATPWGLFRYPWVIAKLVLILSVVVVGATLISPVIRGGGEPNDVAIIAGSAWDVIALLTATALSVVKPGSRR
jgi:hypothetical protein